MVVGWSDFAMGLTHTRRGDKEPDGITAGLTSNATQQSKHFQCGSATVLCGTVNLAAQGVLTNVPTASIRMGCREISASGRLTCFNSVNRMGGETGLPIRRPPSKNLKPRRCP